jgi:hypothetical protein
MYLWKNIAQFRDVKQLATPILKSAEIWLLLHFLEKN